MGNRIKICLTRLADDIDASGIIPIYSESISIWGNRNLRYGCVIFAILQFYICADSYLVRTVLYVMCGQEITLGYLGLLLSYYPCVIMETILRVRPGD